MTAAPAAKPTIKKCQWVNVRRVAAVPLYRCKVCRVEREVERGLPRQYRACGDWK